MDRPFKRVLKHLAPREKILERVEYDTNGGCWLWTGGTDGHGYGTMDRGKAHRISYREFVAPIPDGSAILHRCDIPACANPAHLFPGTQLENIADMVAKGRQAKGEGLARRFREVDVALIRSRRGENQTVIAREFGVRQSTISRIMNGERWKHSTDAPDR